MSEQENPAEVQPNTENNAEVQSNTNITSEQFNNYAKSNGLKVFNDSDFNTLKDNLLKEGSQKSFNSAFGKGLDKAKNEIAQKFGLEIQEDSKLEDVLNNINPKSKRDNEKDLNILRDKLTQTELSYQERIAEMQKSYQAKEVESVFNSVWSSINGQIEGTAENVEKLKNFAFHNVSNSLDFTGDVVKRGEFEYKDELRNAISKEDAIKSYLLETMPLKPQKPVNGGNGLKSPMLENNAYSGISTFNELVNTLDSNGIDINSDKAMEIQRNWMASRLKKK